MSPRWIRRRPDVASETGTDEVPRTQHEGVLAVPDTVATFGLLLVTLTVTSARAHRSSQLHAEHSADGAPAGAITRPIPSMAPPTHRPGRACTGSV
jgi:hypothetical protein